MPTTAITPGSVGEIVIVFVFGVVDLVVAKHPGDCFHFDPLVQPAVAMLLMLGTVELLWCCVQVLLLTCANYCSPPRIGSSQICKATNQVQRLLYALRIAGLLCLGYAALRCDLDCLINGGGYAVYAVTRSVIELTGNIMTLHKQELHTGDVHLKFSAGSVPDLQTTTRCDQDLSVVD